MADYFVYWNSVTSNVRIHRAHCGACKNGDGMHRVVGGYRGLKYDWERAKTYAKAVALAGRLERSGITRRNTRLDCGLCHPNL
jgi:hypothetical protein